MSFITVETTIQFLKGFIIVVGLYLVLFSSFQVKWTSANNLKSIELEYNGLVWCGLDMYTIWKYGSYDKPMKVIRIHAEIKHDETD